MTITLALTKEAIRYGGEHEYTQILGEEQEEFFFDDEVADLLEKDSFFDESFDAFGSLAGRGDCDFFPPEKCKLMKTYFEHKIKTTKYEKLKEIYSKFLEYASRAIELDTGVDFDF